MGDRRVGKNLSQLRLVESAPSANKNGEEAKDNEKRGVSGRHLENKGEGCKLLSGGKKKAGRKIEALQHLWQSEVDWSKANFECKSKSDHGRWEGVRKQLDVPLTGDSGIRGAGKKDQGSGRGLGKKILSGGFNCTGVMVLRY